MTKVLTALVVSALLVVTLASAVMAQRPEPVLPAEVITEFHDGGVYVQPIMQTARPNPPIQIGCRFIVAVDKASVGAILTGTINGAPVATVVVGHHFPPGVVHHGRAYFDVAGPGPHTFVMTNTTPAVNASC